MVSTHHVYVGRFVCLNPGCVGRVGMSSKIFNPPSPVSGLGIQCPALVCGLVRWVPHVYL